MHQNSSRRLGGYLEFQPPAELASVVECLWVHAIDGDTTQANFTSHLVLPDPGISLAFSCRRDLSGRVDQAQLILIGSVVQPRELAIQPCHELVAIKLFPEFVTGMLHTHPTEHTDAMHDLLEVAPRGVDVLFARLTQTRHWKEGHILLASYVASVASLALPATRSPGQLAAATLRRAPSRQPVTWTAAQLGISGRQLHRRLHDTMGVSPKTYSRVLRFNRLLAAADATCRPDLASLAAATGYTDQAHMCHEFQDLTGHTPTALLGSRQLESTLYTAMG